MAHNGERGTWTGLRSLRTSRLKTGTVRSVAKSLKKPTNDSQSSGFHLYSPSNSRSRPLLRQIQRESDFNDESDRSDSNSVVRKHIRSTLPCVFPYQSTWHGT